MVACSCQGARRGIATKVKVSKALRKPCNRAAMTYVDAIRPKGNGKYRNSHCQIKNAVQKLVEKLAPRVIQQSHSHRKKYSKKNISKQHLQTEWVRSIGHADKKKQGKFMFFDWKSLGLCDDLSEWKSRVPTNLLIDIRHYRKIETSEHNKNKVFFNEETNDFLFSIISKCQSSDKVGGRKSLNETRRWVEMAMKKKPDVRRGKKTCGRCDGYKIFGIRKDPLGTGIGTYSWKQGVTPEEKKRLNECAFALAKQLETASKVVEKKCRNLTL